MHLSPSLLRRGAAFIAGVQSLITAPVKIAGIVSRVVCLNCAATNKKKADANHRPAACFRLPLPRRNQWDPANTAATRLSCPLTWTETARVKKTKQNK